MNSCLSHQLLPLTGLSMKRTAVARAAYYPVAVHNYLCMCTILILVLLKIYEPYSTLTHGRVDKFFFQFRASPRWQYCNMPKLFPISQIFLANIRTSCAQSFGGFGFLFFDYFDFFSDIIRVQYPIGTILLISTKTTHNHLPVPGPQVEEQVGHYQ